MTDTPRLTPDRLAWMEQWNNGLGGASMAPEVQELIEAFKVERAEVQRLESAVFAFDMLDVDRLNQWAQRIEDYGANITEWGSPAFVAEKLRDIARRLERSVRSVPATAVHGQDLRDQLAAARRERDEARAEVERVALEWERECDDADRILSDLGVDDYRTDGGSLRVNDIVDHLRGETGRLVESLEVARHARDLNQTKARELSSQLTAATAREQAFRRLAGTCPRFQQRYKNLPYDALTNPFERLWEKDGDICAHVACVRPKADHDELAALLAETPQETP